MCRRDGCVSLDDAWKVRCDQKNDHPAHLLDQWRDRFVGGLESRARVLDRSAAVVKILVMILDVGRTRDKLSWDE